MNTVKIMNTNDVIEILKSATRLGTDKDTPEGTRYIQLSDTLVQEIICELESEILTPEEDEVIQLLAGAWNKFMELPVVHAAHNHEFMHALHAAQRIILARTYLRNETH